MQRTVVVTWFLACLAAVLAAGVSAVAADEPAIEAGFHPIFDGKTLHGWHASAGPATAAQAATSPAAGGWSSRAPSWAARTFRATAASSSPTSSSATIEVALEMNNDFGPDSGLFLRCDEAGTCYQAMIDYHVGGNLMGLYGEGGLGAKPNVRNFTFLDRPDHIVLVTETGGVPVPVPFPMPLAEWPRFWKHGQWNELRARIVGNPPHITTWIKGVKFMDWTESVEAPSRQGRHRPAGSRRRRFHQAVRPLPQHPAKAPRSIEVTAFEGTVPVFCGRTPQEWDCPL